MVSEDEFIFDSCFSKSVLGKGKTHQRFCTSVKTTEQCFLVIISCLCTRKAGKPKELHPKSRIYYQPAGFRSHLASDLLAARGPRAREPGQERGQGVHALRLPDPRLHLHLPLQRGDPAHHRYCGRDWQMFISLRVRIARKHE